MKPVFPNNQQVEKLIEEVERRPVLYDRKVKGYTDHLIKKKEWLDVTKRIVGDDVWASMSKVERNQADINLRRRWLNLRNSFARELRIQKDEKPTTNAKRRRRYCYFNQLMFLLPTIGLRDNPSSGNDSDIEIEYIDTSSPGPHLKVHSNVQHMDVPIFRDNSGSIEYGVNSDCDEDKHFALSLVPMLKRLSDFHKLDMKVSILNLFKNKCGPPDLSPFQA